MTRIALIAVALLALTACGEMTPEKRAAIGQLGASMTYSGAQIYAASQPQYVYYPAYSPGAVRYCGTDGMGRAHFCY
jgi:hypothetical protein